MRRAVKYISWLVISFLKFLSLKLKCIILPGGIDMTNFPMEVNYTSPYTGWRALYVRDIGKCL